MVVLPRALIASLSTARADTAEVRHQLSAPSSSTVRGSSRRFGSFGGRDPARSHLHTRSVAHRPSERKFFQMQMTKLLPLLILSACGPTTDPSDQPPPPVPPECVTALPLGATTLDMGCDCKVHEVTVPEGSCAVVSVYPQSGAILECAIVTEKHDFQCADGANARVWVEALVNGECERKC